jgi:hypothetical protein
MAVRPKSFGPADWDAELADPAYIYHGLRVRTVHKEGVDLLVDSILRTGWDPNGLAVRYRDLDPVTNTHIPQRFLCLNGRHRMQVARQLLA